MKLYIPRLRDKLFLEAPWTFKLYSDHRNHALAQHLGLMPLYGSDDRDAWSKFHERLEANNDLIGEVTIPAGVVLSVDRIFIRNGARDYDSVTFRGALPPRKAAPRGKVAKSVSLRFWAKLDDANTIEFEPLS